MSRVSYVIAGAVSAMALVIVGGYIFVRAGGISMETTAAPLPFEKSLAEMALVASVGNAAAEQDPLPVTDGTLTAGVQTYRDQCALCHGIPGQQPTAAAQGMFPPPPQLFEKDGMMIDDPEGATFWKVTHGIRLSGMPGFVRTLSDTQRWQVTMLVAHADRLSPSVKAALTR
jgi:thiosulfate dehydrogenase